MLTAEKFGELLNELFSRNNQIDTTITSKFSFTHLRRIDLSNNK